jgi:hypothetical protein
MEEGLRSEGAQPAAAARRVSKGAVVTVFGSSRAEPGDAEYLAAERLGRLIARRGWTLCNGGHEGTMEAAARGAKEAGGSTLGVTVAYYESARPNRWLDEEIVAATLLDRLEKLVMLGDAFITLRGGIGTLLELALVWNLIQRPEFAHKPVVIVGDDWAHVIRVLSASLPMRDWERTSVSLASTVDDAVATLGGQLRASG